MSFFLVIALTAVSLAGDPPLAPRILRGPPFADMKACQAYVKSDEGRTQMGRVTKAVADIVPAGQAITLTPKCLKMEKDSG
jgi:hypothetical protein